jgi:hypothetical protein
MKALGSGIVDVRADCFILLKVICFIGSYSALIAYILIESSRRPIGRIAEKWENHIGTAGLEDEVVKKQLKETDLLLLVDGISRAAAFWGRLGTPLFTLVVAMAWLFLIVIGSANFWMKFVIAIPTAIIFVDFISYLLLLNCPKFRVRFKSYVDSVPVLKFIMDHWKAYMKNAKYG